MAPEEEDPVLRREGLLGGRREGEGRAPHREGHGLARLREERRGEGGREGEGREEGGPDRRRGKVRHEEERPCVMIEGEVVFGVGWVKFRSGVSWGGIVVVVNHIYIFM